MSYLKSAEIVKAQGLKPLSEREFWNLDQEGRNKRKVELTDSEEYTEIQRILQQKGWHCRIRSVNSVDAAGNPQRRVLQDLFFCSSEQIELARRFVSEFVYITDVTFRTNRRRLPLTILTGITSTGSTFPFGYCFVIGESAESFKFQEEQLTDLMFYDRARPRVLIGDFAAGLAAAVSSSKPEPAQSDPPGTEQQGLDPKDGADSDEEGARLEEAELQAAASGRRKEEADRLAVAAAERKVDLQLCEWHAVQAIRRKLVKEGYKKEKRQEVDDLLWAWVQSPDPQALEKDREALLGALRQRDQTYLKRNYQPKEHQFVRAYTRDLPNLGCHTTQRGEGNHHITKGRGLNRHLAVSDAVRVIIQNDSDLEDRIREKIDKERRKLPRQTTISRSAFADVALRVTHYCLELLMPEWAAAKQLVVEVLEQRTRHPGEPGSPCPCSLPKRYGLPCRHWLYKAAEEGIPIPRALLHPRWFYDEPAVPRGSWRMAYPARGAAPKPAAATMAAVPAVATSSEGAAAPNPATASEDRFRNQGTAMLDAALLRLQEAHRRLPGWQAEQFAVAASEAADRLTDLQRRRDARHAALPVEIPRISAPAC